MLMASIDTEMEPLMDMFEEQGLDISTDDDGTPYQFRVNGVTILYENLKDEYMKVHKKIPAHMKNSEQGNKGSWMRVKDGHVKIAIEINNESLSGGTFIAKVVVHRDRTAYEEARQMNGGEKYVAGEVSIGYQGTMESDKRWILSLDLDSVYNAQEDGYLKEVYGLCPSNIDVTNKFRLITELFVRNTDLLGNEADRLLAKKESKPFLMRTEPRRNKSTVPESPASSQAIPSPSDSTRGFPEEENGYTDGSFNYLSARTAHIGTLNANKIQTANRDIGYHIPLNNLSQKGTLVEGDVVGFFEDDNQRSAIERINKENYDRAKLAGVITRSYYVEGLCPEAQKGISDLVCVIGIVKVRVLGMVRNGDLLYAYKKVPGVAATSATLRLHSWEETGRPFLIGQALESNTDVEHDQETLVSAFVSVVNGIDSLAMNLRVERLNDYFSGLIQNLVVDATKKIKRRFFWLKLLLIAVLVTIGIALWQRYAPNTLLRASLCKRGNFEERAMTLSFNTSWQEIKITALEFKYEKLKQKIHNSNLLQKRPGEGMRYFVNFERCKNRGASYGNEYVDDTPTVSGPEILSSDKGCNPHSVRYLNGNKWMRLMTKKRLIKIIDCHTYL